VKEEIPGKETKNSARSMHMSGQVCEALASAEIKKFRGHFYDAKCECQKVDKCGLGQVVLDGLGTFFQNKIKGFAFLILE
jgi:hypothetical protein